MCPNHACKRFWFSISAIVHGRRKRAITASPIEERNKIKVSVKSRLRLLMDNAEDLADGSIPFAKMLKI
jgi:hypothetical protein